MKRKMRILLIISSVITLIGFISFIAQTRGVNSGAFILIFSCFGVAPYADQILTVIAGLCAAILSMLAFIADKLSAKKE